MNSKLLFERTLQETSGGYLQKRHSDHLSSSSIPGTRVYPYPGTTQEPVRNSYHHSGTHLSAIPHHLSSLYSIGSNSGHSTAVGPQTYREVNYSVDRHEFSPIDRYRNRNESNDISGHHSTGGSHSNSNAPTGATTGHTHTQQPLVRRRPSLLPHVPQNDYLLNTGGSLSSQFVNRDRYDIYRFTQYENRGKGSNQTLMPSNTASQHSGPSTIHMVQHGLHLPVAPHQTSAIVSSQHLTQPHVIQDIQELNVNKRPRLGFTNDSRPSIHQPLLIDTRDMVEVKKEPAYVPQVEAISPTLPNDDIRQDMSPLKSTKDELLQNINKIDREISITESQITKLRKKHQDLELVTNKPSADIQELQDTSGFESQLSVAQLIYSDNKSKTMRTHSQFDKLGPSIELPLYNQPSDTVIYHENKRNFISFKKKLIQFFKKRFKEKELREHYLTDTYDKLMLSWLKKLEKKETNPPKKAKDIKLREYFEKQFPELRKQREDKERFSRVGQRIRSDAELEEIMDGLQEQELEDKKIRSYAVIPPILLDTRHRKYNYINLNGIIEDPMSEYKERQVLNIWTDQEKEIFREKYLLHPKNFGLIASFLDRKSISECVQYYYSSKKSENYKQLLRKQVKKRTRALVKAQQQQQQQQQAIAAQAQSQQTQQRPAAPVANRQQNIEELNKTTSITVTTTIASVVTTTTSTTTSVSGVSNTVPIINTNIEMKTESNLNESGVKCDIISDNEENNGNNESSDVHQCCLCEATVENFSKSRPVSVSNLNLYNISNNQFKPGIRVCLMCHFKSVRRHCPLPSCKTPRRKVKRLKSLPQQWFDLNPEMRQLYANQLKVPNDVRTACPRCVMRISRTIGLVENNDQINFNHNNSDTSTHYSFTDYELEALKTAIKEFGKNWSTVAAQIRTKTENECRDFYLQNKISLNLIKFYKEFCMTSGKIKNQDSDSDDFWNDLSDGDSEETSSAEEGNDRCNSDTASASSPINKVIDEMDSTTKSNVVKTDNSVDCSTNNPNFHEDFTKLQDYKGLSASQTSLKSDYDSSATMSADEGQGNGDAERLSSSPAVSLPPRANSAMPAFPPSNSLYLQQNVDKHVRPASHDAAFAVDMVNKSSHSSVFRSSDSNLISSRQKVPPFLINPNAPSTTHSSNASNMVSNVGKEEPTCVRDLIYQAIEMSLQSPLKPMRTNSQPMIGNEANKLEVRETVSPNSYPLPIIKRENIIDMTKVDNNRESPSRLSYKSVDIQRPEGLAVMASYTQHLSPSPSHSSHPYVVVEGDDYEVQDLSKKDRRIDAFSPRNYSPSLKEKSLNHRNDYSYGLIPVAHSNQNRSQTSNSTPTNEPTVTDIKDNYNSMKSDSGRHINHSFVLNDRISSQEMLRSRASPSNKSLNKATNKPISVPPPPPLINSGKPFSQLSPKMYKEKVSGSAPTGGSITQGTPGIQQREQPNSYVYSQNRYEGLLRQIPSVVHRESGSITLGTPLMGGNPNPTIDSNRRRNDVSLTDTNRSDILSRNVFEPSVEQMFRRTSPPTASSYSPSFHQNLYKQNKIPFHKESQLSSNQIMIDFNTSKQMLTRRGSNSSERDGRSSTPIHNPIESRSSHSDPKGSQNRIPNSYTNYNQSSVHSPVVSMSSSVYTRESPNQPQILGPSEGHLNQWSARHSPIGTQSPNYNRQNVIQQHWNPPNTKQSVIQTPKSSSPRDYRTEAISPVAHPIIKSSASPQISMNPTIYSQSHDAFTTLVNAAVAQQNLVVPNMDRRPASNPGSRLDPNLRSNIKDKSNVEGLEKSLMEMHGRPRNFTETDSNRFDDKLRGVTNENDSKQMVYQNKRTITPNDEYNYALEQQRRIEFEQQMDLERQRYSRTEQNNSLSQSSLRISREPFSREQFEKELRQPTEPIRNPTDHTNSFRLKSDDLDPNQSHEPRLSITGLRGPQVSELDNEASKLFSRSFQKDNSSGGQFTAANLIDAIITHQINASTESPNTKVTSNPSITTAPSMNESPQTGVDSLFVRYNEKLVPQYPNREEIVTIADSPDPDRSYPTNERIASVPNSVNPSPKSLTLGEHIATIISKNYSSESRTPSANLIQIDPRSSPTIYGLPPMNVERSNTTSTVLEGIAAAAVSNAPDVSTQSPPHSSWKLRKALQKDNETKESDERQIIRIVQNVSPKERTLYPIPNKKSSPALSHYNVEPISPPTHSSENSSHMTTTYTPMQTTWSPTAGIHSIVSGRHFYGADTSDISNVTPKQSLQTMAANQMNNRSNPSQIGLSPLDYVKNRIVEVMRTTTDDTNDDLNKRPNNDINLIQSEKSTKDESDVKSLNVIPIERHSNIDSINKINTNCLKREISRSPAMADSYKNSNTVSLSSSEQKSSVFNCKTNESETTDRRSPAKKMRKSCDQDSSENKKPETTLSENSESFKTDPSDKELDSKVSQSSNHEKTQCEERNCVDNSTAISSSEIDIKSKEKMKCEVSSGDDMSFKETKSTYPESPNSVNSPGEMVIDESDQNLTSSLSPNKNFTESPPTSSSQSTQQSLISTTDLQRSDSINTFKTSLICSSSEIVSNEVLNQSHSVSSSVIELNKTTNPSTVESSVQNEMTTNYSNVLNIRSENVNSANNSVSSSATNISNNTSNPDSRDLNTQSSVNVSGVTSSSIVCEGVPQISSQSSSSSSIQSSAVSASGAPTSTTSIISTPQYEPLSDDE